MKQKCLWALLGGMFVSATAFATGGGGMQDSDIPTGFARPADPSYQRQIDDVREWAGRAFAGREASAVPGRVNIDVIRQDHSVLHFGESCIDGPIAIGKQSFKHGLGTHANSILSVTVPVGAKTFKAFVGVDMNQDTQGKSGSVIFSVVAGDATLATTEVLRGGEEPKPIQVDLPQGVDRVILKVDGTEDGLGCDQADWADAQFVLADGSQIWLDDNQSNLFFADNRVPFSFVYGGKPSSELLSAWKKETSSREETGKSIETISWTDPETNLKVTAEVTTFTDYPAVDSLVWFENTGDKDTPIIEDIQALDTTFRTGYAHHPVTLHQLDGDACGSSSFTPKNSTIEVNKSFKLAPTGGRSSSISAFPWFNIQYGDSGVITAVGWTGQWAAQFDRTDTGPTRVRAGIEKTHLLLHPGEKIRGPRVVMMPWTGNRVAAHVMFRRLVLFQYVPRLNDKPLRLPVVLQTFDRYNSRPGWATEAGQKDAVQAAKKLGCDTYWLDAAWFPGNFPNGVGNWFCKPEEFPNGLKPVGDIAHQNGMRFVLWFEPERVAKGTQIAEEHPEFVHGGKNGGLFKLDDPEARRFLTELLSKRIDEYGIDIYRNDFNMDPLSYWRDNDTEDRQGMTEIRYITGLYEMWDELRARHDGLSIDNCSSGGRRIDIEMCSRSMPLWRSDTSCSPGHPDWNQVQVMGLSQYVPLQTACVWIPNAYDVRSASTGGLLCQFGYMDSDFPEERAERLIAEAKENQKYWYGDFYSLTQANLDPATFTAYQVHRPDLDAGVVYAYRRPETTYRGLILGLNGIDKSAQYDVVIIDENGGRTSSLASGAELASNFALRTPEGSSSVVVRYAKH